MRLIRRAAPNNCADRAGDLFGHYVGDRPGVPSPDEFLLDDTVSFSALFQCHPVPLKELPCDGAEGVPLLALCRGPLARRLDLGVDAPADQLQPSTRLLPRLVECDRTVFAEQPARRMFRVCWVARDENKALVAALGHPEGEPWDDGIAVVVAAAYRRRLPAPDEPVGKHFSRHTAWPFPGQHRGNRICRLALLRDVARCSGKTIKKTRHSTAFCAKHNARCSTLLRPNERLMHALSMAQAGDVGGREAHRKVSGFSVVAPAHDRAVAIDPGQSLAVGERNIDPYRASLIV
jgi:hypothetical protein